MTIATDHLIIEEDFTADIEWEAWRAYVEIVGEDYATIEEAEEAYQGWHRSDEIFAENLAEDMGFEAGNDWPANCIDWEKAARELMFDYSEHDGYYFRKL